MQTLQGHRSKGSLRCRNACYMFFPAILSIPHLGQKESGSLSQWWGVHFISRKFISCLRKKEAWILMTAFYVIFIRPGVQKLTSGGIKLILGFSKDKTWFCSKDNAMMPEASTVLGSEVFSKWFVSTGQISISLEQQRAPEPVLMFLVVSGSSTGYGVEQR